MPFLVGRDLNTNQGGKASRHCIYFRDWPLDVARSYPECLQLLEERARPERLRQADSRLREKWWLFKRPTIQLYDALDGKQTAIALSRHSNTLMPLAVPTGQVFGDALVVFASDDPALLALLSSSYHWWWAATYGSTLRKDIRYVPTDSFETFPLPELDDRLRVLGAN